MKNLLTPSANSPLVSLRLLAAAAIQEKVLGSGMKTLIFSNE